MNVFASIDVPDSSMDHLLIHKEQMPFQVYFAAAESFVRSLQQSETLINCMSAQNRKIRNAVDLFVLIVAIILFFFSLFHGSEKET